MSNPTNAKIVSIGDAYSESRKQAFLDEPLIRKALDLFSTSPEYIAPVVHFSRQMGKTALMTEIARRRGDAVPYRSLNCLLLFLVLTRRAHVSTIDKHETRIRHGY